jgi:hypothetical protein
MAVCAMSNPATQTQSRAHRVALIAHIECEGRFSSRMRAPSTARRGLELERSEMLARCRSQRARRIRRIAPES